MNTILHTTGTLKGAPRPDRGCGEDAKTSPDGTTFLRFDRNYPTLISMHFDFYRFIASLLSIHSFLQEFPTINSSDSGQAASQCSTHHDVICQYGVAWLYRGKRGMEAPYDIASRRATRPGGAHRPSPIPLAFKEMLSPYSFRLPGMISIVHIALL